MSREELALVAALFAPLFGGLVFHGFCIKFGWLDRLAVPVDGGLRLRGRPLFGANKTYRGLVAVALGAAAAYSLQGLFPTLQPPALRTLSPPMLAGFGLAMGGAAMLAELPNSLLKRQLGIAPGAPARGSLPALFYVLDQVDFLLGAWLVAWPLVAPGPVRILASLVFVVIVHQLISTIGARLGMRSNAR